MQPWHDRLTARMEKFLEGNCRRMTFSELEGAFGRRYPKFGEVSRTALYNYCRRRGWAGPETERAPPERWLPPEATSFIRDNAPALTDQEMAEKLEARLGRRVSKFTVKAIRRRLRILRRVRHDYNEKEKQFLTANYPTMPNDELERAFAAKFGATPFASLKIFSRRRGLKRAAGAEQGCVWQGKLPCITVTGNGPGSNRLKHVMVWESVHGKKPQESRVLCLDGNMFNCEPDNLALSLKGKVNQAALMREIGPGRPELARAWLAVHNLDHHARVRKIELDRKKKEDKLWQLRPESPPPRR